MVRAQAGWKQVVCDVALVARALIPFAALNNTNQDERRYIMKNTNQRGERNIRARGIPNDPPDLRRLARALIELAQAQAEADAQAQDTANLSGAATRKIRRSRGSRKDAA